MMNKAARAFVCAVVLSAAAAAAAAENGKEFVIERYRFTWVVVTHGTVTLAVNKSSAVGMTIELTSTFPSPACEYVPLKEAQKLAKILASVDKHRKAMQNSPERVEEIVDLGKNAVIFRHDPKTGFRVLLKDKVMSEFSGREFAVSLNREEVKAMIPYLAKADKLAAFLDKKLAAVVEKKTEPQTRRSVGNSGTGGEAAVGSE